MGFIADIVFGIIAIIALILGWKKGLIGFLMGFVLTVVIIVGTGFLSPKVAEALYPTSIGISIEGYVDDIFQGNEDSEYMATLNAPIVVNETGLDENGDMTYSYSLTVDGEEMTIKDALTSTFSTLATIPMVGEVAITLVSNLAEKMAQNVVASVEGEAEEPITLITPLKQKITELVLAVGAYIVLVVVLMIIKSILKRLAIKGIEKVKTVDIVDHLLGLVISIVLVLGLGFGLCVSIDYASVKHADITATIYQYVLSGPVLSRLHDNNPLNDMLNIERFYGIVDEDNGENSSGDETGGEESVEGEITDPVADENGSLSAYPYRIAYII